MSGLPDRHAAVIGINAYGRGVAPLRTAVADARAVAAALEEDHGYRDPTLLLDADAKRDDILHLLETTLPEVVRPESALVLYFAGHGLAIEGDDGPQGYLFPHDADVNQPATWLRMTDFRQAIDALPCRHLLVVLDCCFAGSFRWSATRASKIPILQPLYDSQYARYLEGDAWQVLTSASHQETAQDIAPGSRNDRDHEGAGHSPFAAAFLRGLAGDADSSRGGHGTDGVITATELYQHVFEELVPIGAGIAQRPRQKQTPGLWPLKPAGTGQFIFGNPQQERNTRPDPPLDDANNPWLGLTAYSDHDAPLFFGRGRVIEALEARLADAQGSPLIAVVGASGTGKSSVVKAGLLPRLRQQAEGRPEGLGQWAVVACDRLRAEPEKQLHAALTQLGDGTANDQRLLVIDQFEELYTQCDDTEVRERFLAELSKLLAEPATQLKILLTMRSDFEARLTASPSMAAHFAAGRFLVPAFSSEELRDIIAGPAQVKALYFDPPELVGTLVDEVMAMPGGLPLLSFALAEIYRQAQLRRRTTGALDRALTRADYRTAGGVTGALHRQASKLHDDASPVRRLLIRRLFLRMVSLEGGRLTRRRVSRHELDYGASARDEVDGVLDDFIGARLLVASEEHVEPAHDTLVVAWEKVSTWLSATGTLELQRQAWRAADGWRHGGRAHGLLWDGDPRLPQVAAMRPELNRLERDFVDVSIKRKRKRWQVLAATVTAVVVALAALALYSLTQARLAESRLEDAVAAVQEIEFTIGAGLRPIAGAAKVREELQTKTRELLSKLRAESDPDLQFQLAANYDTSGALALRGGNLEQAVTDFRQGATILEEVLATAPVDDGRRLNWESNLTVIYQHLGRVAFVTGDLETAKTWAEKCLEISRRLSSEHASTPHLRRNLSLATTALADIAAAQGAPQQARELYQQALKIARKLVDAEPTESQYQSDVAVALSNLGQLAISLGAWQEARSWFLQELEISRKLARDAPENADWQDGLASVYSRIAMVASILGDEPEAREMYQQSFRIQEELARAEPENLDWQRGLASAYLSQGDLALAAADPTAADEWYRKALRITEAMLEKEPANTTSLRSLATCHLNLGSLAEATGDLTLANTWHEQRRDVYQRLVTAEAGSAEAREELAGAHHRLGSLAITSGDAQRARQQLELAIALYRQLAVEQPDAVPVQNRLVQAYNELGQMAANEGDREAARALYQQGLLTAEALAEKGPGLHGKHVFGVLLGYQGLAELLAETDPDQTQRYLELYRELRGRFQDHEMIKKAPPTITLPMKETS